MKKEILISTLAAGMLAMTGCGGGSDSSGDDAPTTLSAQFIDSPVQGLSYDCQSSGKTGVTDSEGRFNYVAGDTCTFKVGTVTLGSAQPTGPIFTPRDLTDNETVLTNTLRLLQTLDNDGDPDNGITLPEGIIGTVDLGADFDAEINAFLAENDVSAAVVTAEDANAHFEESTTVTLTESMFNGKTYTFGEGPDQTVVSYVADGTFTSTGDGDTSGSWKITDNKLVMTDNIGTTTITFRIGGFADATAEDIGQDPHVMLDVPYTVTTTVIGSVDTTVTAESVLTNSGLFGADGYVYDNTAEAWMWKALYTNSTFSNYDYNATSDTFELYTDTYTDYEIKLVDGVWVSKTVEEWEAGQTVSFNAEGSLVMTDGISTGTYTLTAYDVAGQTIATVYPEATEIGLPADTVFSAGAQSYALAYSETGFQPAYRLGYWPSETCDDTGCIETSENDNYERYYNSTDHTFYPYTSIPQFLDGHSTGNEPLYFWNDNGEYAAYFNSDSTISLFMTYDISTGDSTTTPLSENGSYEIKTVGSTEILVLTLPDIVLDEWMQGSSKHIYSVQDGKLRQGEYFYAPEDDSGVYFNEIAARDIYASIMSLNSSQSSAAPARSTALVQETDAAKTQSRQQALKAKEASRKLHRGF